jgi:Ion channel
MSEPDNGTKSQEELDNEALVQAIAQTIVDRLDFLNPPSNQDLEIINNNTYPRYASLVSVRKLFGILAGILLLYSGKNTFERVLPDFGIPIIGLTVATISIVVGLTLIVLLVFEVFLGAGVDIERELKQGNQFFKEYHFIPSTHKLPFLIVFLGLGFFSIILGFSSFYSELFRHNPNHFSGLKEGFISIYFSIVTFSTVGYGDINPVSLVARTAAICEIFIAMFFSLIVLSTTLSWVMAYEQQQHSISIKHRIQEIQKQSAISNLQDSGGKIEKHSTDGQ